MTEQHQMNLPDELLNTILTGGLHGLLEVVSLFINHAMLIKRHRHLGAAPYQRAATAPALARWMEINLPEDFTFFAFPEPVRQRLRTSNLCETLNKQLRRRTRVASICPNPESCLRLISALLMEISKQGEDAKAYLNPQLFT